MIVATEESNMRHDLCTKSRSGSTFHTVSRPLRTGNENVEYAYNKATLLTQLLFQLNALIFIKSIRYYNLYFLSLYS
jgi:hypothetical protein